MSILTDKIPVFPKPLVAGDRIAIVSPAGYIDPKHVHAAVKILEQQGWRPYIGEYALGRKGSYSGTDTERFQDLSVALKDPLYAVVEDMGPCIYSIVSTCCL